MTVRLYAAGGLALLAAAAGLGAVVYGKMKSPLSGIPPHVLVVYIGSCKYSQATGGNLLGASDAIRERVLPVPIDAAGADIACKAALPALSHWGPVMRFIPDATLCRALTEDAARFHARNFSTLPAFSIGATPIGYGDERAVARKLGIELGSDAEGGTTFSLARAAEPSNDDSPAPEDTSVNQAIGW